MKRFFIVNASLTYLYLTRSYVINMEVEVVQDTYPSRDFLRKEVIKLSQERGNENIKAQNVYNSVFIIQELSEEDFESYTR